MMDINVILSGFIGSFLGVISGFVGAVYLDWRRNARERRTHILALRREILSNNVRVQVLLKDGRREGALDDRAWRELRVPLAGDLPADIYNRVASRTTPSPRSAASTMTSAPAATWKKAIGSA